MHCYLGCMVQVGCVIIKCKRIRTIENKIDE